MSLYAMSRYLSRRATPVPEMHSVSPLAACDAWNAMCQADAKRDEVSRIESQFVTLCGKDFWGES